jgi:hypothetical protein
MKGTEPRIGSKKNEPSEMADSSETAKPETARSSETEGA